METTNIVAEIGINHNGDLDLAKRLICSAKECGADYVKLQKRNIRSCYTEEELQKPCESIWGHTILDKVKGRELNWDQYKEIDDLCSEIGIEWSASCFDLYSLRNFEVIFPNRPWNKIPSAMAIHPQFVKEVASFKRLTLISIGLCSDEQVEEISRIFESARCEYVFMHTVSLYPCPLDRLNLAAIPVLAHAFHDHEYCMGVGYSGHEVGVMPSVMACGMGAMWVERHISLDRSMYGSDQAASLEPPGLERLVRDIRALSKIRGDGVRRLYGDEKNPVKFFKAM